MSCLKLKISNKEFLFTIKHFELINLELKSSLRMKELSKMYYDISLFLIMKLVLE